MPLTRIMTRFIDKLNELKYEILIFGFFIVSRLPGLGSDMFNTDVWKWKMRIYNFSNGIFNLNFEETLQRYHPGVTLMWLGTLGVKLNSFYYKVFLGIQPPDDNIEFIFNLHFFQKLVIVFALAVTISFIFYALRKMFGAKYAVIFSTLLILEPFYIALTRVVHLEGLMSTFLLASLVWLYFSLNIAAESSGGKKNSALVVSALFAALAVLTKTSALIFLDFAAAMILLHFWFSSKSLNSASRFKNSLVAAIKLYLPWLGLFLLFFVILWPAVWVNPGEVLTRLWQGVVGTGIEEGHEQFYFGRFVDNPGISFYFVVFFLRSSVYLILGLIGLGFYYKKVLGELESLSVSMRNKRQEFIIFVLLFATVYLLAMTVPSKKLDRYLLPSIISMLLVASFFYEWLLMKFMDTKLRFWHKLLLFLFPAVLTMSIIHPSYLSFYNPMFGGIRTGLRVLEPKWMIGQPQIVSYLEALKKRENLEPFPAGESVDRFVNTSQIDSKLTVGFQEKYYTQIWPFVTSIEGRATIKDITAHATNTRYFIYPVWDDDSRNEKRFKIDQIGSIKLRGVEIYKVYERVRN
jgi:hypothetical protein